jgi:hypothetical protein
MSNSYVLLEKIVVPSAGASSVTFSNIPQTGYTDLKVVMSARTSGSAPYAGTYVSFNNTTGASTAYSMTLLEGFGGVASSKSTGIDTLFPVPHIVGNTATANTFGNAEIYIPNYTSANFKSVSIDAVTENNSSTTYDYDLGLSAGLYASTGAITTIKIQPNNPFVANSTFYLYGVAKLGTTPTIAPKATGGDVIDTDGTYWYHIFNSSGTFTPATDLTCDYLVIAGGAGGGGEDVGGNFVGAGGGGAGGYRTTVGTSGGGGSAESALSLLTNTAYTVTIGAGGAGGVGANNSGVAGSNSVFATITSTGGGRGGSRANGFSGGSGGGAGSVGSTGGAGTTNQGYAGGNSAGAPSSGGGGGGAGGVGANQGGLNSGGNGGAGIASSITGTSVSRAGGGGGGTGGTTAGTGTSGGGSGGVNANGTAGTANTGGGGGGAGANTITVRTGGAGGSGIVVVRYLVA